MLDQSRARARLASHCRIVIVIFAIWSLTASVATRYAVLGGDVQKVTTVQSQSPEANRQRLLGSALEWTAPASIFTVFQPPRSSVLAVSVAVPSTTFDSESWLYNRPPPSC